MNSLNSQSNPTPNINIEILPLLLVYSALLFIFVLEDSADDSFSG